MEYISDYKLNNSQLAQMNLEDDYASCMRILTSLKNKYQIESNINDRCLQLAEAQSSLAAQRILDRVYFEQNISDDTFNNKCPRMIFLMHLNLDDLDQNLRVRKNYLLDNPSHDNISDEEEDNLFLDIIAKAYSSKKRKLS